MLPPWFLLKKKSKLATMTVPLRKKIKRATRFLLIDENNISQSSCGASGDRLSGGQGFKSLTKHMLRPCAAPLL